MEMYSVKGILYGSRQVVEVDIADGAIVQVKKIPGRGESAYFLAPGLVDVQVNGYNGIDFNQAGLTINDVDKLTRMLWEKGVTTYCPTIITNSNENTELLLRVVSEACHTFSGVNHSMGGIHLEGPFISPEEGPRGAHPLAHVKAPDWELFERWQQIAGGRIRLVTLSPEWPGAVDFIEKCVKEGVVVSIGHTAASSQQINDAVDAGARLSTHLGNGAHLSLPRHPNYIWDQLANDNLNISVIADGFHLPDSVLRVFLRAKPEQTFLISDSTSFAGMPPGEYAAPIGGNVSLSADGRLALSHNPQLLAGSAQSLLDCVNTLKNKKITSLQQAWDMASCKPMACLNSGVRYGINEGSPADLVLFESRKNELLVKETIKNGQVVFRDEAMNAE